MGFFKFGKKDREPELPVEIRNNLRVMQDSRHGSLFGASNGFSNGKYEFYAETKTGKIAWFGKSTISAEQNQFAKGNVVLEGGLIRSFELESNAVNAHTTLKKTIDVFNKSRTSGKKAA